MAIKRRDFLKLAGAVGAGTVYSLYGGELAGLFGQAIDGDRHVIWLQGASDSGCTISLLQGVNPDLVDAITNFRLAVDFLPTLMIPSGDRAMLSLSNALAGRTPLDLLIIEGAVPSGTYCAVGENAGKLVPFETWVKDLGAVATRIVAVGTCASFGGIPAAKPNPTNCRAVSAVLPGKPIINIPGCPAHPDWILLTLATLLSGTVPSLDQNRRPSTFFHEELHDECPLEDYYERRQFAEAPGRPGCLYQLGCRGSMTSGDCPRRLWNNKTSFCMSGPWQQRRQLYTAGAPCIGCTQPGFPDPPYSPFYVQSGHAGDDGAGSEE